MKKAKYNNKRTMVDGINFDSKAESLYYMHLKRQKLIGLIKNISLQPSFILQPGFTIRGERISPIRYIADFHIVDKKNNQLVIDVKGMPTPTARLKRKMFLKEYPDLPLIWIQLKNHVWVSYFTNEVFTG